MFIISQTLFNAQKKKMFLMILFDSKTFAPATTAPETNDNVIPTFNPKPNPNVKPNPIVYTLPYQAPKPRLKTFILTLDVGELFLEQILYHLFVFVFVCLVFCLVGVSVGGFLVQFKTNNLKYSLNY